MSDRKYRQRGYQDEDRGERREPRRQAPRERPEGPRGRGLGAPSKTVFRCAACGRQGDTAELGFDTVCLHCGADLHTCSNCRHFDTSTRFECRQPIPERIAGKGKRNRCEHFEPKLTQEFDSDRAEPEDPKAAFDALFKL